MRNKTKYTPRHAHLGDIGADPREFEFEPIAEPAPVEAPVEVPEPELVPA